jgi:CubicO group peptidase (beta-lactamase class C family)
MDTLMELTRSVLAEAVQRGEVPGAVAAAGRTGRLLAPLAVGVRRYGGPATTVDTRYDLASLTKVVATLPCVLRLISDGAVALDDTVGRFVTSAGWFQSPSLADVTLRELLGHTSGLPNWRPIFAWTSDRLTALANVLQTPLGERGALVYSDLGFIVLGHIVERVSGQRLDRFAQQHVFAPLGMHATGFVPEPGLPFAATEDCGWRNQLLMGVVHDENAFRLDGVAGHAGLFSTAADLALYAQAWLRWDSRLGAESVLRESVREHAQSPSARRGLGWLLRSPDSFAGRSATDGGFGHTGFTGTSLWIEPEGDRFSVLLTNRVHPSRRCGSRMHELRRAFHDAAAMDVQRLHGEPA